jgi:hypothetical protein
MGRPELLLAVPDGSPPAIPEKVTDLIEGLRSHQLGMPPLVYECLEAIDDKLGAKDPVALSNTMAIVMMPEVRRWPAFARRESDLGMSLTINSATHRSPLLQLVCQYPEVYWVFVSHPDDDERSEGYDALLKLPAISWKDHFIRGDANGLTQLRSLITNHENGFRTLFDPTGLRAGARWHLSGAAEERQPGYSVNALSLEDETSFALFNGYVLFRRGYSTYVASTLAETKRLLGPSTPGFSAVIEDLFLNFRDEERHELRRLAMLPDKEEWPADLLQRRMTAFSALKANSDAFYHLVISAGMPERPVTDVVWASKPYGGMFARELDEADQKIRNSCRRHLDDTDEKIRKSSQRTAATGHRERHGTPGPLHAVAEDLVLRAGRTLGEAASTTAVAIHAAVLALDARRCLADSKSSLALTALGLQHKAEVMADCLFIGRLEDLNAGRRLDDLHDSVRHIVGAQASASPTTTTKRKIQRLDAMIHFATELGSIYDSFGQFDEAESLRQAVLRYQLDIQVVHFASLREPVSIIGLLSLPGVVFKYYIGALLRSGWAIAGACVAWIGLFASLYAIGADEAVSLRSVVASLLNAGFFFVSGNAPPVPSLTTMPTLFISSASGELAFQAVVFLNCLCGFVHLGIFIAYLYSKVARK